MATAHQTAADLAAQLCAALRQMDRNGTLCEVPVATVQDLVAAAIKAYVALVETRAAEPVPPAFRDDAGITPTDVMITAGEMLRAADLEVFELEMWRVMGTY